MSDRTIRWLFVDDNARGSEKILPEKVTEKIDYLRHLDPAVLYGAEAIQRVEKDQPDVVLLDLRIAMERGGEPDRKHGAAAAVKILRQSAGKTRVLLYSNDWPDPTSRAERKIIKELDGAGVIGYLQKQTPFERTARAIAEAAEGSPSYLPGEVYDKWKQCLKTWPHECFSVVERLKPEEHKIMVLSVVTDWTAGEIARFMSDNYRATTTRSVNDNLSRVYAKLGTSGIRTLSLWAQANCPVVQDQLDLLRADPRGKEGILTRMLRDDDLHGPL